MSLGKLCTVEAVREVEKIEKSMEHPKPTDTHRPKNKEPQALG